MGAEQDTAEEAPRTYLVIDGENLDSTLGMDILKHRPAPEDRPRWERALRFVEERWGQDVRGLFFLNASSGTLPMGFIQAMTAIGFRVVPLSGPAGMKVVDVGIQRTLDAIVERAGDVVLGSHDADFLPQVEALRKVGRRVALLGFREFMSLQYSEVIADGVEVLDLEDDARCFNRPLPRLRVIDIDDFDPLDVL